MMNEYKNKYLKCYMIIVNDREQIITGKYKDIHNS